tara:strand:- start:386 stop:1018 length:633 start_codon:yes stop_codon:yes gene_type:complete
MNSTKPKILAAAIKLFNGHGLVNVRLQKIADESGISVGNLAYHYYSKKAIVVAIDEQLENEITPLLTIEHSFPYLIDFDNHLSEYYFLLNNYSFYFLDFIEIKRAYPSIHKKRKIYIDKMIAQINKWMLMNISKGILKEELQENHYRNTAHTIWMIITFWLTQQQIVGEELDGEGSFKIMIWNQLLPLLTKTGWLECEAIILPQLKYYEH